MIEINLLPHREAKRAADLRQTFGILVLGVVLEVALIYMVHNDVKAAQSLVSQQVRQLEADIERYKPQERQVAAFKEKRGQLESKLDVIKGLDRARSGPVRLLDELANRTPERLWLTHLQTRGVTITVEGESLDNGLVADFLRSMNSSRHFINVDLDRTTRGAEVDGVKLVNFLITAELTTPADEEQRASPEEDA